jgi:type VI secretion system protein VasI
MRWVITSDKSALDDSVSVYVSLDSTTRIPAQYQSYTLPATLLLRCQEGSTAVLFGLGDHFMADIQSFGRIDYRIDDRKASHLSTLADTSNKFLGLWSGKRAIPFIKSLFDGSKLVARITPFNESPFEVTFDITGTKTAVADLRKACKW